MDFNDFNEVDKYDGIWCSGTLLHVEKDNLKNILLKLKIQTEARRALRKCL